ncbi:hypothetical protein QKL48_gp2 [Paguma larvata torque teno virus]|nr:hypothetical protein QKL48_gp2 [Paguma larvata torque teno virus]BBE36940.1 hypothetical protein [Paguma larvata torque teno virus]
MTSTPEKGVRWSDKEDRRARKEALWLQSCSQSHAAWCRCGNWTSHIRGVVKTPPCATEGDGTEDTAISGEDAAAVLASLGGGSIAAAG